MAKKSFDSSIISQIMGGLFTLFYLCIGFVPNWGAVDKIAPQWLIMSLINFLASIYVLIYFKKFKTTISILLTNVTVLFYFMFFVWAAISYFYAINPTEALVNIPRHANTLFMMCYLFLFLYKTAYAKVLTVWSISIILGIEVYSVLNQALEMFQATGNIDSGQLKGITANRNITAFSIVVKIPFLLMLIENIKKKSLKVFVFILCSLSIFSISIIASRASFIAVGLVSLGYIALQTFNHFYLKKKSLQKIVYIIAPVFFSLFFNQFIFSNSNSSADVISRAATIKVDGTDNSINQRLRYYEDVLSQINKSPLIGVGIGNWKIKSIDYDKNDINGYIVPYHAHSDFIQIGAELGIFGFFIYIGIFISSVILALKLIMSKNFPEKEKEYIFMLLIALGVYFIDANLNFPIARPQVLFTLTLILALISISYSKNNIKPHLKAKKFGIGFPIIGILIFIPSISVTNTTYESLKSQMLILQDFNSNKYNLPLNQIETFIPPIPNITVTTIPMDAIKARYYFHYKNYDKALALAEEAKKANPYLGYPEILKSQIYLEKGELEKAWAEAKIAFEHLPKNQLHANQFINLSIQLEKREAIKKAYHLISLNYDQNIWKNYLIAVSQLFPFGEEPFVSQAAQAIELFPDNQEIRKLHLIISLGNKRINEATNFSKEGLNFFNSRDYSRAAIAFEKAFSANPMDYAHYENAATSNYLSGNLEKALKQIDVVVNDLNPLDGKCEYIKALIYIRMGDNLAACPLLEKSRDSGYSQASSTFDQYCK